MEDDDDNHDQDDDEHGHIHIHDSYMPDYESDDASSDVSSTHSPPMSLFLDRPDTEREEPALVSAPHSEVTAAAAVQHTRKPFLSD